MEEFKIIISKDFSPTPGGRWRKLGPSSGEQFYQDILLPEYEKAKKANEVLHIYLDGVKGYPYSFVDQSFGEIWRVKKEEDDVSNRLMFHTESYKWLIDFLNKEIWVEK